MEFSHWYVKSINEAKERNAKEEEEKQSKIQAKELNEKRENDLYDADYGSIWADDGGTYTVTNNKDENILSDDDEWVGI